MEQVGLLRCVVDQVKEILGGPTVRLVNDLAEKVAVARRVV